jgi:hypothetical protein
VIAFERGDSLSGDPWSVELIGAHAQRVGTVTGLCDRPATDHLDLIMLWETVRPRPARSQRAGTPTSFLSSITDGAVLQVLHLNGYKINNPTVPGISHEELEALFIGYGYTPYFVEGSDPQSMHRAVAATMEHCALEIRKYRRRYGGPAKRSGCDGR